MDFFGFHRIFIGFLWISTDFQWISLDFNAFSMDFTFKGDYLCRGGPALEEPITYYRLLEVVEQHRGDMPVPSLSSDCGYKSDVKIITV